MTRARLRDLGITIGKLPTGPHNAITDVPGVLVGHTTLIYNEPRVARTGVTMIVPREGNIWHDNAFAACHTFNGTGELTGTHWIAESGLLCYPIGLTNSHQVGLVRDSVVAYGRELPEAGLSALSVAAETYDGWLNDIDAFHLTREHVVAALANARSGPVAEGNVGGGTGMICHDFKGGIGTASRLVGTPNGQFTVGVLVQTNYGDREDLRVAGAPVGALLGPERVPLPWNESPYGGSILVIIATDAPLLPVQCSRLARRATVGVARTGGVGHHSSGDIFLAFATGNHLPERATGCYDLKMLPHPQLTPFFEAVAEATQEAILNALTAAETMTGFMGRTAHALPLEELKSIMDKYSRL